MRQNRGYHSLNGFDKVVFFAPQKIVSVGLPKEMSAGMPVLIEIPKDSRKFLLGGVTCRCRPKMAFKNFYNFQPKCLLGHTYRGHFGTFKLDMYCKGQL